MKKKNLIILLLMPFVISLLGIVAVNVSFHKVDNDIAAIEWEYNEKEAFGTKGRMKLQANAIVDNDYQVSEGNELVWEVKNADGATEPHAKIEQINGEYYLVPISAGEVIVTCRNQKGNVSKTMRVTIFDCSVSGGAIVINPAIRSSNDNIDVYYRKDEESNQNVLENNVYYGEYDLKDGHKVLASFNFNITTQPAELKTSLFVKAKSDNIDFDLTTGKVTVKKEGDAYFTIGCGNDLAADKTEYFKIVNDGINVYSFEDLMYCTNKSTNGEIVVLRKSFESSDTFTSSVAKKYNNVALFGTNTKKDDAYGLTDQVYHFETTYNHEYIDKWNEFVKTKTTYKPLSTEVITGLHVQKDFYGNGYTINFHNLTYPYGVQKITDEGSNQVFDVATLTDKNLFRGPLSFYTLGDPANMPLITAFGQDNSGMYVDGNNIVINDVNIKNCDDVKIFSNLDYVGTVMDIHGDNVTVKNSRLANGKNVIRSFSSMNLTLDNCAFSRSRNFLFVTGSNEYEKIDETATKEFVLEDGTNTNASAKDFLKQVEGNEVNGDSILNNYVMGEFTDKEKMETSLLSIQSALNDTTGIANNFKGETTINNCYFYQSGIASIALESLFNGPFLYSKVPSGIENMLGMLSMDDTPVIPYIAENISGVSYPVKVKISGNTSFYDYKNRSGLDLQGLISENISALANSFEQVGSTGTDVPKITIDNIFPMKNDLFEVNQEKDWLYNGSYINIPVAYYGGGANLSKVEFVNYRDMAHLGDAGNPVEINLLKNYLDLETGKNDSLLKMMKNLMLKTVTVVTGFEPFKFICMNGKDGYLYGKTFTTSEMRNNALLQGE